MKNKIKTISRKEWDEIWFQTRFIPWWNIGRKETEKNIQKLVNDTLRRKQAKTQKRRKK
jgi:hypothetical protein